VRRFITEQILKLKNSTKILFFPPRILLIKIQNPKERSKFDFINCTIQNMMLVIKNIGLL